MINANDKRNLDTAQNTNTPNTKKTLKRVVKIFLWLIGITLSLIIILVIVLQFPKTQTYLAHKATAYLSGKIKSKVELGGITIAFPKSIVLDELYIEDLHNDTLLYSHSLNIDINLSDLLSNKIVINSIEANQMTAHIHGEYPDTNFNYSFIADAFSSPKTETVSKPKDSTGGWQFSIKHIKLQNIYLTYNDTLGGTIANIKLGELETTLDAFDLDKKKIHAETIKLLNSAVGLVQNKPVKKPKTESKPFDYDIGLDKIDFTNVKASYIDHEQWTNLDVDLGTLLVEMKKLDIKNETIDVKSIALSGTSAFYVFDKIVTPDTVVKIITQKAGVKNETESNWIVTLDKLEMKDNTVGYSNKNTAPLKTGVDPNNLLASKINIQSKNIYFSPAKINMVLDQMSFDEKSGFILKNLSTKFNYDSTHIELANLDMETNKSRIRNYVGITFNSMKTLADSIGTLQTKINLDQSYIAVSDILLLNPELLKDSNLANNKNTVVNLNTKINGTVDNLKIDLFELSTKKNTIIKLKGVIKKIREPEKMYADISSFLIITTREDIYNTISPKSLPQSIAIPASMNINGAFKGYVKNFDANLDAKTSLGEIIAGVKMNPALGNKEQPYAGKINIKNFDFGKLLKQEKNFGAVTMNADLKGHGFDTTNLYVVLKAQVDRAFVNGYDYKNLSIDGTIDKMSFTGTSSMNDSNLTFNYNGRIDLDNNHPEYKFTLDLTGADLGALHLTKEDLRIRAKIESDLHGRLGENITGNASIRNILAIKDKKKYTVDSIIFVSTFKDSISDISLKSEIMTADFNGKIVLNELPAMLEQHLYTYFHIQKSDTIANLKAQKFKFEVALIDPTLLTENLIPDLKKLSPSNIKGSYDSDGKKIDLTMNVPQIIYSGITVDSLKVNITSDAEKLKYDFRVTEISNPTIKLENIFLGGGIKNNVLDFQFNIIRDDSSKVIAVGGIVKNKENDLTLTINPQLTLDNKPWTMDKTNYMQFGNKGMIANNFILINDRQEIALNSLQKNVNAPLEIKFTDFDISTISKIIENNNQLVAGVIDGTIVLKKQNNRSAFTSDIIIKNFAFQSHPIGNITLRADNTELADKFSVDLSIIGNENDIHMKGYYRTGTIASNLNFILDVNKLNLASLEPFMFGSVTRMSGSMNGKLNITGSAASPAMTGTLTFKKCALNPTIIDSYLKIDEAQVTLESKKVRFNSFTLIDSLNNKAVITGYADIKDLREIKFDMHVVTNNFLALNTTRADNDLYFGTVYLNSNIHIKGTMDKPVMDVTARLNKGTVITYITPADEVPRNESEGIVEFADTIYVNKTIMTRSVDTKASSKIKGIELNAKLNFDRDAELRMLVDPVSGDSVYVKGSGSLDFSMDQNGNMTLIGKYTINDGGYHLSVNEFVKRNFRIERGSSITWSGDIMDAYVDISAIYETRTSPLNLVQDELAGMDEFMKNKYRTLQKFLVYLKMRGFISSPEISFDIQLPANDRGVLNGTLNAKLSELRVDENQLNKQVFALLTLNRFIGQDPLESSNQGVASASRTSASRLLTQQLSNLSAKYVKAVDLNIGVNSYEDYSSGTEAGRTQLQLGLSKQILNDKITIQVGGNVELEGEKAKQNNASDIAGNVSIEYKLTDDGRYKIKVYRETQYENPIEGELTKTAVGFIFKRDFKKFKDLFAKPKHQYRNKK
jgi:translocation and assembly module TamB